MSKIKAVRIDTDGKVTPLDLDSGCEALQAEVGGSFDLVTSATGETSFWVNDEGKLTGLPINTVATILLYRLNPVFRGKDFLCGPVVLTGGADENGNTLSLSKEAATAIIDLYNVAVPL
ncbi:MAG: DUF3846 domain-containing protein [Fluviibacter sp.]